MSEEDLLAADLAEATRQHVSAALEPLRKDLAGLKELVKELRSNSSGRDGFFIADHAARLKNLEIRMEDRPGLKYREVYQEGQPYGKGDAVTWGGALWIALRDTQAQPGFHETTSRDWRLAVKEGRRGKEGKQGPPGPPGPRGERGGY